MCDFCSDPRRNSGAWRAALARANFVAATPRLEYACAIHAFEIQWAPPEHQCHNSPEMKSQSPLESNRGKLAYARQFARPPEGIAGALVITANRGLMPAETPVRAEDLQALGLVDIHASDPRYREPLLADLDRLRAIPDLDLVLLGSVATGKYVDVLLEALGRRLRFPPEFVGRGDMSRGALLLRAARSEEELAYIPVEGADRHGPRPPRLEPVR